MNYNMNDVQEAIELYHLSHYASSITLAIAKTSKRLAIEYASGFHRRRQIEKQAIFKGNKYE